MKVIEARNVRDAYSQGIRYLMLMGRRQTSRAGEVLVVPHPVVTVYGHPCERVLLDPRRDCNPFFHLMEAMWMLAGRNDVTFLDRYVSTFSKQFGEADGTEHDAYGFRWRKHFGYDQLDSVIERLQRNPDDRQCVIQMWDATEAADDLLGDWKTRPCNTHIYLRVRDDSRIEGTSYYTKVLDLTVCCRSNDMIYGGYGANAVHFSFLQEYLAARIGIGIGKLYQFSNNFHGYMEVLNKVLPVEQLTEYVDTPPVPLIYRGSHFHDDLRTVMRFIEDGRLDVPLRIVDAKTLQNKFLTETVLNMAHAHRQFKMKRPHVALLIMQDVSAPDWRQAGEEWIRRRMKNIEEMPE